MDDWAKFMKRAEGMDGAALERMRQKRRAANSGLPPMRVTAASATAARKVRKNARSSKPKLSAGAAAMAKMQRNNKKPNTKLKAKSKTITKTAITVRGKVAKENMKKLGLKPGQVHSQSGSREEMLQIMALLERADREIAADASFQAISSSRSALRLSQRTNMGSRSSSSPALRSKNVVGSSKPKLSAGAAAMVAKKKSNAAFKPARNLSAGATAMAKAAKNKERKKLQQKSRAKMPNSQQRQKKAATTATATAVMEDSAPQPGDLPLDDLLRALKHTKPNDAIPPWKAELAAAKAAAEKRLRASAEARADFKAKVASRAAFEAVSDRRAADLVNRIAAEKVKDDAKLEAEATEDTERLIKRVATEKRRKAARANAQEEKASLQREADAATLRSALEAAAARERACEAAAKKREAAAKLEAQKALERSRMADEAKARQVRIQAAARAKAEAEAEAIMMAAKARVKADTATAVAAIGKEASAQAPAHAQAFAENARATKEKAAAAQSLAAALGKKPADARAIASALKPGLAARPASSTTAKTKSVTTTVKKAGTISAMAAKWDAAARATAEAEKTNFFSSKFDAAHHEATRLKKGDAGYGTAPEGSKSAARAEKATAWVNEQVVRLLTVVRDLSCKDSEGHLSVSFGELFVAYESISDSLVGMLLRAKKRKQIAYDGEMLLQKYHDDVRIRLTTKGRNFLQQS